MGFFTNRPDRDRELKQLVADGISFSRIAMIMGAGSRNIVLCRFNRMREKDQTLSHPFTNAVRSPSMYDKQMRTVQVRSLPKPKPVPKEEPAVALPAVLGEDGSLVNFLTVVRNMCRFPIGDPGDSDFHVCGNTTRELSPYCPHHHAMCYVPIVRKFKNHAGKKHA